MAADGQQVVGHIAFSPVTIDGRDLGWYGLGPLAVHPDRQRLGIGALLVRTGLDLLRDQAAQGCVLLGDPLYYARFGFRQDPGLEFPGQQGLKSLRQIGRLDWLD